MNGIAELIVHPDTCKKKLRSRKNQNQQHTFGMSWLVHIIYIKEPNDDLSPFIGFICLNGEHLDFAVTKRLIGNFYKIITTNQSKRKT